MERRKAMKIAAGAIIGGGAGIFTLTNAFKPDLMPLEESKKIEFKNPDTNWTYHSLDPVVTAELAKGTGYKINSDERKERCRRLTSDVVSHLVVVLNMYYSNTYVTNVIDTEAARECMTCHSDKGKIKNTSAKMTCDPCHTESVGHKVFADIHYKLMK